MGTSTKRPKSAVSSQQSAVPPADPAPPAAPPKPMPGTWRPTQSIDGKVLQYAWTCTHCLRTWYVAGGAKKVDIGQAKTERCGCQKDDDGKVVGAKVFDERAPKTWPKKLLAQVTTG